MPHVRMETSHTLGQEEAARRLREKFDAVRGTFGGQVNDLHEVWCEHTLSFGFRAMGMKIAGTVEVKEAHVKLDAQVPLAAVMFKGMIETRIRQELGNLLS